MTKSSLSSTTDSITNNNLAQKHEVGNSGRKFLIFTGALAVTFAVLLLSSAAGADLPSSEVGNNDGFWSFATTSSYFREAFAATSGSSSDEMVEITVDSSPRAVSLYIDGVIYSPSQQPVKLSWKDGSIHTIELAEHVWYEGYNKRVAFLQWNDFDKTTKRSITVSDSLKTTEFIAMFQTEYLLTILSEYDDGIKGAGWYKAGDLAQVSVSDEIVEIEPNKERAVFNGWSGRGLLPNSPSNMIEITGPIVLLAEWQEQYKLDVISEFDLVRGGGWYDKGTIARIGAQEEYEIRQNELKVKFGGWTMADAGTEVDLLLTDTASSITTIMVEQPLTVQANWEKMYYVDIIEGEEAGNLLSYIDIGNAGEESSTTSSSSGEGYYRSGQIATISLLPTIETTAGQERLSFAGWKDPTTGREIPNGPSFMFKVQEPVAFQAEWKKQYHVSVESTYGTSSGAGWYDAGSDVFVDLDYSKENLGLGRYATFQGWDTTNSSPHIVTTTSNSQLVLKNLQAPTILQAQWYIDDSLRYLIIGGAVSAILGFGTYMTFLKKNRSREAPNSRLQDLKKAILSRPKRQKNFLNGGAGRAED